jgi:hypothetical protein
LKRRNDHCIFEGILDERMRRSQLRTGCSSVDRNMQRREISHGGNSLHEWHIICRWSNSCHLNNVLLVSYQWTHLCNWSKDWIQQMAKQTFFSTWNI